MQKMKILVSERRSRHKSFSGGCANLFSSVDGGPVGVTCS